MIRITLKDEVIVRLPACSLVPAHRRAGRIEPANVTDSGFSSRRIVTRPQSAGQHRSQSFTIKTCRSMHGCATPRAMTCHLNCGEMMRSSRLPASNRIQGEFRMQSPSLRLRDLANRFLGPAMRTENSMRRRQSFGDSGSKCDGSVGDKS